MEFQFGTNWAEFSKTAGGVIGQTLAMEGVFSSFLNPAFSDCFSSAKKNSAAWDIGGPPLWFASARGSPATLIVATDAWMQHPVATTASRNGQIELASFWGSCLTNGRYGNMRTPC